MYVVVDISLNDFGSLELVRFARKSGSNSKTPTFFETYLFPNLNAMNFIASDKSRNKLSNHVLLYFLNICKYLINYVV